MEGHAFMEGELWCMHTYSQGKDLRWFFVFFIFHPVFFFFFLLPIRRVLLPELRHVVVDSAVTLGPPSFLPPRLREVNDSLSLHALERKVSLHSISITINTWSFILNAFFFFFYSKLCSVTRHSKWRVNLNTAMNSDCRTQLVLLFYSLQPGDGLRRKEGLESTCIMTYTIPADLYSLDAAAFCHKGA